MIIYDIMPPINRASTDGQIELERAADRLGCEPLRRFDFSPAPSLEQAPWWAAVGGRKFAYSSLNKKRICILRAVGQRENE